MRFLSTRWLAVIGVKWTVAGVLITLVLAAIPLFPSLFHSSGEAKPGPERRTGGDERGYTVILENERGDPLPDTEAQLIGDGGPYVCTTDNNGVCTIEHVALLPSLSVRILAGGKKLYEEKVPTMSPIVRVRVPASHETEHKDTTVQSDSRGAGQGKPQERHQAVVPRGSNSLPPAPNPVPSPAITAVPDVVAAITLPPTPQPSPPPRRDALVTPTPPAGAGAANDPGEPPASGVPPTRTVAIRAVRVFVEHEQLPDDARRLIDTVSDECLKRAPYVVEPERARADVVLRCMDPGSFNTCGGGPGIFVALYEGKDTASRAHPLASRDLNRDKVASDGYLLNVADAALKVCKRLNDRAGSVSTALWGTSLSVASR